MTTDPAEFLRARVDEDEADLDPAAPGSERESHVLGAFRAILAVHRQLNKSIWCATCDPGGEDGDSAAWYPCLTLRHLIAVYGDHPDYRQEWKP